MSEVTIITPLNLAMKDTVRFADPVSENEVAQPASDLGDVGDCYKEMCFSFNTKLTIFATCIVWLDS